MLRLCAFAVFAALITAPVHADLVLTAPPRESEARAREVMEPIAAFLSATLKTAVQFRYSDNWLSYQSEMLANRYDIVFDGPHFASWRMAKHQHEPLVKLPGKLNYVIIVRRDESLITELRKLEGRLLCSPSAPNLGALSASALFTNPARQPKFVNTGGFQQAYDGLLGGKCVAAVVQAGQYKKFDPEQKATRILHTTEPLPNQVVTASARLTPEQREALRQALLGEAGKAATRKLRDEYAGKDFEPAVTSEYLGHAVLLKDIWGFDLPTSDKVALKK